MVILWVVVALSVAFAFVLFAALRARRFRPALVLPEGESLPVTPLQRMARWGFALSLSLVLIAVALIAARGPQEFWDNDRLRLSATGLLLGALSVFAGVNIRAGLWISNDDGHVDERDRAILAGASAGQGGAILVALAAWMIALAETFRETGAVPVVFLYLIFWSCLMMNLLAWLAGIIIGYRRS